MTVANEIDGRADWTVKYLEWPYSVGCVLDVFRENQRLDESQSSRITSASDCWVTVDSLRQDIFVRARRYWCLRTGLDETYFPLSVDAVSRLYHRLRKRMSGEVERFEQRIESACSRLGKCKE